VKNFLNLCRTGFYNGTKFHRTVPGFMVQGGDPNTKTGDPSKWGTGGNVGPDGQEITVPAEFNDTPHVRGVLSMARSSDPNSASSQFFICVGDASFLDGKYTAFGRVVEGMEVVDKIVSAPAGPPSRLDQEGSRPVKPVVLRNAMVEKRPAQVPKTGKAVSDKPAVPSAPAVK
jgi:cyclophilin family peptidyl-prolyl cis-trans isomerase